MSSPVLAVAPWAKGRYDSYRLNSRGQFLGTMHPPGFAFMANSDQEAPMDEDLQFMSNHNLGTGFGAICASLPKSFSSLQFGDFPCELILHRGIFSCPKTRNLSHLYYKCSGNICPYANLLSCMNAMTMNAFIKEWFPPPVCVTPIKKLNVRCLNQISGYTYPAWKSSFSFAVRDGKKYHQNTLQPDIWYNSKVLHSKLTESAYPRMKLPEPSYVDGVSFSGNNDKTSLNIGRPKLRQFSNSLTLSLYCLRRVCVDNEEVGDLVWVPLPNNCPHWQEFALIHPLQKEQFDAELLQREPGDRFMTPDTFRKRMLKMVDESDNGSIRKYLRLKCGFYWKGQKFQNFIVSLIQPAQALHMNENKNQFHTVINGDSIHWVSVLPKNVSDIDLPVKCFPIFRGYEWPYKRILDDAHHSLLVETYYGRGQIRPHLNGTQFGQLRMLAFRQSNQASSNMGEVSGTINHHYWVESTTNTSLVQQTAALSNALSQEAVNVQNNSGQVVIGLVKRVIMKKEQVLVSSSDVCPHMICTIPYVNKKTGILETYSNGEHTDCDTTNDEYGELVNKYVQDEGCMNLKEYAAEMRALCPNLKKTRWPLPTTCCSTLNDPNNLCSRFTHRKYFVVPSGAICWDISSDIMLNGARQLGSTFHGHVASHLTSCSIWIDDDGMITTINPGFSDPAWGTSGGYAYLSRVGRERREMVVNLISNYMTQNNGVHPRLPGVNVANYL